jgi:hypothetical protein
MGQQPGPSRGQGGGSVTRRRVLVAGLLGAGAVGGAVALQRADLPSLDRMPGVSGWSAPFPPELRARPVPVGRDALSTRRSFGPARHVYEVTGRPSAAFVTPDLGERVDAWLALHRRHVGQAADEVRTFGAWVAGSSSSWHSSGEAVDVARLRGGGRELASLRHDVWRDAPASELARRLRTYWRTAAGLHHEFADVLTYLYDDAHANHVHVDLGRFGAERPRLIRRSRVQAQGVQAMLVHVWGRTDVTVTGELDDRSLDAAGQVAADAGRPEGLDASREAWQAFLVATMQRD